MDEKLHAIAKQPFAETTENTNLQNIKDFLTTNGFLHKKSK